MKQFVATKTFADFGIDVGSGLSGEVYVRCPQCERNRRHKNRKPLGVNVDEGLWFCHHCHDAGSLKTGWKSDPERHEQLRSVYLAPRVLKPLPAPEREKVVAAVEVQRSIPREVLESFGVQFVRSWCLFCEDWVPAVAFPYLKAGKHVHTKYRHALPDGDKHLWTDNHTERCLYGYDEIVGGDPALPIVICEGEYDALVLRYALGAGYRVGSVPDGAGAVHEANARKSPESGGKAAKVVLPWLQDQNLSTAILEASTVILAIDGDAAGLSLRDELGRRIGFERCRVVTWPDGCNDANDVLVELGAVGVREAVGAARPYPVEGLLRFAAVEDAVDRLYASGLPSGVSAGWDNLDPFVRFLPGQFVVVFGTTGSGKSHWVNQLALNVSAEWSPAICSPESGTVEQHAIALLENRVGKPFDRKRFDGDVIMQPGEYEAAKRWLDERVTFVLPRDRSVTTIVERMRAAVIQHGSQFFVIDNWMSLHHDLTKDKLDYIEKCLTQLQEFWAANNSVGVLVVHTTKPPGGVVKEMGLYGPAHSAGFPNRADIEIEIIRDRAVPGYTKIAVQKVRSRWSGREGSDILVFDAETGRYRAPLPFDRDRYKELTTEAKGGGKKSPNGITSVTVDSLPWRS